MSLLLEVQFLNEKTDSNTSSNGICISTKCDKNTNANIFSNIEKKYSIKIRDDVKKFLIKNSGGYPIKDIITSNGNEYEVRVFLSLDDANKYYNIEKPLSYFMKNTNKKMIPIGVDSGSNYYCIDNQTGKVYYWCADGDSYLPISSSLNQFISLFN